MPASDAPIEDLRGARNLPRWFSLVFSVLKRIEKGCIDVRLPDGRVFRAQGHLPGPYGLIECHDNRTWAKTVRDGARIGFAEAYVEGFWSTPDLHGVLDAGMLNNEQIARKLVSGKLIKMFERFRHWLRSNTRFGSKRNIMAHYDLGNEFYRIWLDGTMTYSSALYTGDMQPLETAQANKYGALCDAMEIAPDQKVLEIGCGWGGFAEYAAKERGAHVTGITLSPAQLEYARERVFRAGLNERVSLELRDYRDERGKYDRVASIEMFEAVGEKYWPIYFESLRERLVDGGRAGLQVITISDELFDGYRRSVDFVQKHIFPGGMLPSRVALRREAERAGLQWSSSTEFGGDYSTTLREWSANFNDRWGQIAPLGFDERFKRLWNFYLASCAACFLAKTTDVTQVSLIRT